MNNPTVTRNSDGTWIAMVVVLIYLVSLGVWIWQLIRLAKRKDKSPFWLILILGIVTIFILLPLWAIISLFLGRGEEEEREEKEEDFYCGICCIKYKKELLGGETLTEGKICRWCLDKKKRGEK